MKKLSFFHTPFSYVVSLYQLCSEHHVLHAWFLIIRRFNVFQYHISRPLSHLTTRQLHGSHGCLKHSLMNQPVIIFSAINNILHIYRIILYLIKNQIPFFNKHLMIFIWWNVRFFKKWKTLRHMIQGTDCCYYFLLFCAGGIFINLSYKPNMRSQHPLCPVRNNYFVLFICHSLYLCNHILKICVQFIYCASTSPCHPILFYCKQFLP